MRVFFNAIIVQILFSTYVLWRGWNALPSKKVVRIPFAVLFGIEVAVYLIAYFFTKHIPDGALKEFGWIGTTWMVFIIYMTALLLLYDVVRLINKRKPFVPESFNPRRYGIRRIYFFVSLILVVGVLVWGSYRFHHPTITELELKVEKTSPRVKNMKIVVATDLHAGTFIDRHMLKMYVDKIMEQNGDMILLVGDIIDYDLRPVVEQNMQEEFGRLKARYGVYGTTGNHEYIELKNEAKYAKIDWLVHQSGLTMLRDTAILIDDSFYLVGREDDKCPSRKSLNEIMRDVDRRYPIIVMNHEPHVLQEEVDAGTDIAVYGHTHNGQFFPVNLSLKFIYELPFGYKKKGDMHAYVSSGLGLAGPQYRIGTISEIVVLNVKFE